MTGKFRFLFAVMLFIGCGIIPARADGFKDMLNKPGANLADTRADSWKIVGDNIIATGNVFIPYGDISIRCDKAIVNIKNKDLEAAGNIRFYVTTSQNANLTPEEFSRLSDDPKALVVVNGYETDPMGNKTVNVTVYYRGDAVKADKVVGNLASGTMQFKNMSARYKTFIMMAKSGTRKPGGEIIVKDAKISACSYVFEDNGHYSISCGEAKIYPHIYSAQGLQGYNPDRGEHSIWAYNCTFDVFGLPVLWLPVAYKPRDESPGIAGLRGGYDSDWGAWVEVSKSFDIADNPRSKGKIYGTWFSKRGFGYGGKVDVVTAETKTKIAGFSIYDMKPYEDHGSSKPSYKPGTVQNNRLSIPHERYDFRLSHLSHITPRLDLRGTLEVLSDYYMLNDFFYGRSVIDIEPATFASLEYQFNRASVAAMIRPRMNSFFTVAQRLPEFRVDVPRQELFKNIYYQSNFSFAYMKMSWRDYDRPPAPGFSAFADPRDYEAARFDTVHFLYYPLRFKYLNIIPRLGGRLTSYSNTSKQKVNENDLQDMFQADDPDIGYSKNPIVNYDDKGGAKVRFAGEVGVQANTKIYRSWQDVKCAFLEMDGLRHVFEPYINYTYIPEPTLSREKIYYFDEIDRLERINFVRFGIRNRLQTRSGSFLSPRIREWFSMENYFDLHLYKQPGFNNVGDLDSLFSFTPTENLSMNGKLSVDLGQNSDHNIEAVRGSRLAGRPGISSKWINQLQFNVEYKFMEDVIANLGYAYQDKFKAMPAYSMGSTLTQINAGRLFDNYFNARTQQVNAGIKLPITPDRKTYMNASIYYDFEEGSIDNYRIQILRDLHCWTLGLEYYADWSEDRSGKKEWDHNFMATMSINTNINPLQQVQRKNWQTVQKLTQGSR